MLVLGIETSCDETSASVVKNGRGILSNFVSSSLKFHKKYGGVIPEIATRHHVENLDKVINCSLKKAKVSIKDIDLVAVTKSPGLIGALLTGISCAKTIAYAANKPLLYIDHLKAHVYSSISDEKNIKFPFLGLVISGGHTRLSMVKDYDKFEILGDTLDDAIGEAYDKVAKIMGLEYPGGPIIDKLAKKGDSKSIKFTCRSVGNGLDFSFSGIKTAVLYYVRKNASHITHYTSRNIAASFQESVLKVIVDNSLKAMEKYNLKSLAIGGGVSANSRFREMIEKESKIRKFKVFFPPLSLCSDNAAMVAGLAYRVYKKGNYVTID